MDEIDPEMQQYSDAAVAPYYALDRHFKRVNESAADTTAWKRITHQPNATYAQPGAAEARGPVIASSIMVLEFRSGVLVIKCEIHDMEDGEFAGSYEVGTVVSYAVHGSKHFWPALMAYITETEDVIVQNQQPGSRSDILRLCQMLFNRHLRKYGDRPVEEG